MYIRGVEDIVKLCANSYHPFTLLGDNLAVKYFIFLNYNSCISPPILITLRDPRFIIRIGVHFSLLTLTYCISDREEQHSPLTDKLAET